MACLIQLTCELLERASQLMGFNKQIKSVANLQPKTVQTVQKGEKRSRGEESEEEAVQH